jgi:beta-N-acetylhexosaminidase
MVVDLRTSPFHLDDAGVEWVTATLAGLSQREKVGQLFCEILWDREGHEPEHLFRAIDPGAVMYRPAPGRVMQDNSRVIQSRAKVPLLIACNLERGGSGGNGGLTDGTYVASPMGVAATDDSVHAYRTGLVAAREGSAAGITWTFEPIVDLDLNPENPITNVRTYGSSPDRVIEMGKRYIDACHELDVATTIKHFPGDGVDFRDQHLLASVNSLSVEEWEESFGRVYRELIAHGAPAVMSAHILQPALARLVNPALADHEIMPASLSRELNVGVLRERLGFNGVIVSDATQMVGFTASMPRRLAIPTAVANGCDMILFTLNQSEDVNALLDGIRDGLVSDERVDEAVTRILALKASVGLHIKERAGSLVPPPEALDVLRQPEHLAWARECADSAVTLVTDAGGLLPISPTRSPRIELVEITNARTSSAHLPETERFKHRLESAGFDVRYSEDIEHPGVTRSVADYSADVDLLVYFANMSVSSSQTSIRLTWDDFLGANAPRFVRDVPTLFVSFSNPYHLVDVPMVGTYVNAYSATPETVDATVERLLGAAPFTGVSPVDPFASLGEGRW